MRPSLFVQSGPVRQSPKVHLSPLMSTPPFTPSEQNGYMVHSSLATEAQPYTFTTTAPQHQSPHTMFIQPAEHMAPAVQLFTPPTPTFTLTPTVFPPEDITKTHTTASYSEEPIPELVNSDQGQWTFSLDVPIPNEIVYPILTSLEYTVEYGTGNGHGTSTIQTSILLAKMPDANSAPISNGITTDAPNTSIYRTGTAFPPQILDGVPVVCLSSIPAIKENRNASQLEHYVDQQQLLPHVRIVEDSRLYLQLNVTDTHSPLMLRSLVVNVAATWVEDMQGKTMQDKMKASETRRRVAERKRAEEEQARLQAERESAEAKQAEEAAVQLEKAAKKKSEDDRLAKQQVEQQADTDRLDKKRADDLADTHRHATEAADAAAQSYRKAKEDADRQAVADHQAELAAEAMAEKDREARSAIERQL
jgi:hypothetical protein